MPGMLAVWQPRSLRPVWNAQGARLLLKLQLLQPRSPWRGLGNRSGDSGLGRPRKESLRLPTLWRNVIVSAARSKNSHKNTLSQTIPLLGHREQKVEHVLWDQTVSGDESSAAAFTSSVVRPSFSRRCLANSTGQRSNLVSGSRSPDERKTRCKSGFNATQRPIKRNERYANYHGTDSRSELQEFEGSYCIVKTKLHRKTSDVGFFGAFLASRRSCKRLHRRGNREQINCKRQTAPVKSAWHRQVETTKPRRRNY